MPVVIGEIVSEVVLSTPAAAEAPAPAAAAGRGDDAVEEVVRRATERVLEHLRREWER
jgi:hypothetical protein